jgi:hypothetical protein
MVMREDRFMKAARIAEQALEMYESLQGKLDPMQRMILRSRLVEQALSLLEKNEK